MPLPFFSVTSLSRKRRADGLNVHPFATFYIWDSAGSGLETIYSDENGLTEKENPFLTDKNGLGGFYSEPETSIQVQPAGGAKQPAVTPPVNPILFDDTTPLSLTSSRSLPFDPSQAEEETGVFVKDAQALGCTVRYQPHPGNTLTVGVGRQSTEYFYDLTEDSVTVSFPVKSPGNFAADSYFPCENTNLLMSIGTGSTANSYFESNEGHYAYNYSTFFGGAPSYITSRNYRFWGFGTTLYSFSPSSKIEKMEVAANPTPPNAVDVSASNIGSHISFLYDGVIYLIRYDVSSTNNTYTPLNSTTLVDSSAGTLGESNYMGLNSFARRNDCTFDNNGNLWVFSKAESGLLYNLYLFDPSTLTVLKSWEGVDLGTTVTPDSLTVGIYNARLYVCLVDSNELHILDIPTL